ncbi:galectin-3-like [Pistacia vera]|uniref:galectin-3-like n=1 Tax=Pistacia vera TaxID=55513 RepID=UPI00126302AB|nr:galectin-3-like [Pistacia vera]
MFTFLFKKMGSRAFLLSGLLLAILLLISSEVAARDLAQTSTEKQNAKESSTGTNGVDEAKYDGNGRYEPQCAFPTLPPPPPPPCGFPQGPPPCGCGGGPPGGGPPGGGPPGGSGGFFPPGGPGGFFPPGGPGGFFPPGGSGPTPPPGGGFGGVPGIG